MQRSPSNGRGPVTGGRILWLAVRPVLRRSLPLLGVMAALIAAAVLIEIAPPLLLRAIVDEHLKTGLAQGLWALAWAYLAVTVAARSVAFGQTYAAAIIGQRILMHLRLLIAQHLERLPLVYFDRTPVGEIMSRSTADVDAVNSLFTTGVIGVITDLFRVAGAAAAMFALNARLAAATLLVIPVVAALTEYFRRNIRNAQRGVRQQVARANSHLQETWTGMRVIHAFGQEPRFARRLRAVQAGYHAAADRAAIYNAYFPGVMETLKALTIAVLLWFGTRPAVFASVTVGDLTAFALLISRLFSPIQELSQEFQTIQEAMAGVERIAEVLREPAEDRGGGGHGWGQGGDMGVPAAAAVPAMAGAAAATAAETLRTHSASPTPRRGRLTIQDLEFGYHPGLPVLRDLSLEIEPGQRVAVVGRTGAGKTSLIHLIAGLYRPWQGRLEIDGVPPISLPPAERRRLLGVVPQTVHAFAGTVRDNITLGDAGVTGEQVARAAAVVGADSFIDRLPAGYETLLGPGGTSLSHGQNQLLCLARALACEPPLLLLDEPTSGIDTETETAFYQALARVGSGRTVVLVSHRLTGLQDMDRVIIVARGRVVQDGDPRELIGRQGWYQVFRELETLGWRVGGG
ncbi:MAG: ABC transporter ATP-binding protein [Bacillota bacterium]|nr:ABC transporter ATP-binding protein [Bacillota bacterium]